MRRAVVTLGLRLSLLVVLVAGWKLYVEVGDVSPFVLPPPEDVVRATVEVLGESRTWHHLWVTLFEIVAGFGLAGVAGVATGVAIGCIPLLDRVLWPYLVAIQVIPKVAVIPLLLLWMGFGTSSKVVVAAIFAYFPITAGTQAGVRAVEPRHRDLAATLRASGWQRLRFVDLPSALPSVLTGMEIGIVLATVGAIVAEYLAGGEGLGWMAVSSLNQLQVDRLYAVILVLSVLGFTLYASFRGLRRLLVPWHPSVSAGAVGL